ncbi:MAG: WXG100 family type VII secretion target [Mycobacterium sp.]
MAAEEHRYRVDLDALEHFADQLAAFDRAAEKRTSEVDKRIRDLHTTWSGADAAAQAKYHQEWLEGIAQMRKVEEELEDGARKSHHQYNQAIAHNRKMWPPA